MYLETKKNNQHSKKEYNMEKKREEKVVEMENFLQETGLWDDPRRKFVLPASVHSLGQNDVKFIKEIGPKIVNLLKVSDSLMGKAVNKNLNNGAMGFFRRTATAGIPKLRKKIQQKFHTSFPQSIKVDLVKGQDGKMYIVEIDTVNTHGLGYGKILRSMCDFLSTPPGQENFQPEGTERILNHSPLEVIVPFNDRFHEGEWAATSSLIETLTFHRENDVKPEMFKGKTILDIHHKLKPRFQEELVEMFLRGELDILVHPKDQLGSKNVLPLAWHPETSEELLAEDGMTKDELSFIKKHLPESLFVTKKTKLDDFSDEDWLLKDVNSNAMKGVVSPSRFDPRKLGNCNVILQRKIPQMKLKFDFFDKEEGFSSEHLFSRYIVYFGADGTPLECLYTATPEELTHGGINAVLGSAVFCDCE